MHSVMRAMALALLTATTPPALINAASLNKASSNVVLHMLGCRTGVGARLHISDFEKHRTVLDTATLTADISLRLPRGKYWAFYAEAGCGGEAIFVVPTDADMRDIFLVAHDDPYHIDTCPTAEGVAIEGVRIALVYKGIRAQDAPWNVASPERYMQVDSIVDHGKFYFTGIPEGVATVRAYVDNPGPSNYVDILEITVSRNGPNSDREINVVDALNRFIKENRRP